MAKVAFLGLGVMGFPMAGHLAAKGHDVTVYNRTFAKAEAWTKKHKGKAAKTPKEAAAGQEIVFCCVGNDEHLRAVVLGDDGAFAGMAKGAIFFDNTTASADIARELHAEGKKKRHRLHRRAGVGRPGRRGERPAHRDVRRRAGAVRQGQAGGRCLRQGGHPDRPAGLGPDHQDDEPDVHRRHRPGPGRGAQSRPDAPASTWRR